MSAASTYTFAQSPAVALLSEEFPDWVTGTTVLRDADGNVCGACYFERDDEGGVRLVVRRDFAGEVRGSGCADDTRF